MADLILIRPNLNDRDGKPLDKKRELKDWLWTKWLRSRNSYQTLIDRDYGKWSKAYEGSPLEEVRSVPFYKASNFVVKLIRIYLDTFVARTLNVVFATKPLYVVEGLPSELREGFELYLNRKSYYDWNHYQIARDLMFRGNKNGTAIYKIPYIEMKTVDVMPRPGRTDSYTETEYTYYRGPKACPVPFEDFLVYPITCNNLCDAEVKFHRMRYVEEEAKRLVDSSEWTLPDDSTLDKYLQVPRDIKRQQQQTDAGMNDQYTKEVHIVQADFQYAITNDSSKFYDCTVLFEEKTGDIFDIYYNPYPRNLCIYTDYRPFLREDLFPGESLCQILGQSQEEASRIHNERRDNSTIASSVIFKRRSGSLIPNPSTNWYPGKVFDLDDMDDLDVVNVGRNYEDMIAQEDYVFNLAERLSGIGESMQYPAAGATGKRGIYNTTGTISVMSEGNQRQDTSIRDVRESLSNVGLISTRLQAFFAPDDPLIDTLPATAQESTRQALKLFASDKSKYIKFEVKTSNAGMNKEIQKANLMAMGQVIGQYGQVVQQIGAELLNPQLNPGLRMIMTDIVTMQRNMAKRLLKAFDEWDAIDDLPDVDRAVAAATQGQNPQGARQPGPPQFAGSNGAAGGLSPDLLQSLAALPPPPPRPGGQPPQGF